MAFHLTEDQAALLFDDFKKQSPFKGTKRGPRPKRKKSELPENQVEAAIESFLRLRGWVVTRVHIGTFVPLGRLMQSLESSGTVSREVVMRSIVRMGKKGECDFWAVRPTPGQRRLYQFFFYEVKAPGKRPTPEQVDWMRSMASCGIEAKWFDDFQDDGFDTSFMNYYKARYPEEVLNG